MVPGALALYFCTPQSRGLFPQQRKEVIDPENMVPLVNARTDPPRPALRHGCGLLPAQCFSNHSSLWGYNPHVVNPTFEVCRSVVFSTFSVLCKSLLSDSRTFAHSKRNPVPIQSHPHSALAAASVSAWICLFPVLHVSGAWLQPLGIMLMVHPRGSRCYTSFLLWFNIVPFYG